VIYPDDLPLVQLIKLYHDMPQNIGTLALILGAHMGCNTAHSAPISAIIVGHSGTTKVSDDHTDVLRQCARCGEQYDYTPDSPAICDDCIATEMEEAICQTCGGTGEVITGQYFDGDYKYAVCEDCSFIDDSAYEDHKDHLHYMAGKV